MCNQAASIYTGAAPCPPLRLSSPHLLLQNILLSPTPSSPLSPSAPPPTHPRKPFHPPQNTPSLPPQMLPHFKSSSPSISHTKKSPPRPQQLVRECSPQHLDFILSQLFFYGPSSFHLAAPRQLRKVLGWPVLDVQPHSNCFLSPPKS